MALMPDSLRLTPDQQTQLDAIKAVAKVRHERSRRLYARRGRHDFPLLPYECSWAYEEEFRKHVQAR